MRAWCWPMTHGGWRLTDGRCTLAYSSSWNALGALKLNQMSTTLHSNTQTTPTSSIVYTSNKNTQRIRLDDNSFENTTSLVENSVTPIDLWLSYNVKSDIYCWNKDTYYIARECKYSVVARETEYSSERDAHCKFPHSSTYSLTCGRTRQRQTRAPHSHRLALVRAARGAKAHGAVL